MLLETILYGYIFNVISSTSVSSPGETMPRSDSADSQSQAIQEEPLPSTSNDDEDPLAGKIIATLTFLPFSSLFFYVISLIFVIILSWQALVCQRVWIPLSWQLFLKTSAERCCKTSLASDHPPVLLLLPACHPLLHRYWEDQELQRSALSSWRLCHLPSRRR